MENIIKRAGCFVGDEEDLRDIEALCENNNCRFNLDCIWKKDRTELSSHLGEDENKTEALGTGKG
ncbi:MAG: hypothetical protein NTY75_03170 [Candidatus Shapirobacteria bacterium]|nr:hypothetical protein [Candidatus Shapirobacteria bacterium]